MFRWYANKIGHGQRPFGLETAPEGRMRYRSLICQANTDHREMGRRRGRFDYLKRRIPERQVA
jgi:hypothetical protein